MAERVRSCFIIPFRYSAAICLITAMTFPWVGGALHFSPMGEEPLRQDPDFDRDFWRAHARRSMQEAFDALEGGGLHFGDWERLFLSAAIDHFRDRHFEQASVSAQRIFSEHQRPPFTGHFT